MSPKTPQAAAPDSLRAARRAADGGRRRPVDLERLTPDEIHGFVHELEVHKIELKIQNEQLWRRSVAAEVVATSAFAVSTIRLRSAT